MRSFPPSQSAFVAPAVPNVFGGYARGGFGKPCLMLRASELPRLVEDGAGWGWTKSPSNAISACSSTAGLGYLTPFSQPMENT